MAFAGLVLDYGHGGMLGGQYQTPGGKQYHHTDRPPLTIYEGVIQRQLAARLLARLLPSGVDLQDCTAGRSWERAPSWEDLEQRDTSLAARVRYANRWPRHLVLSLHSNAIGNSIRGPSLPARGWSVYTSRGQTGADKVADTILAAARRHLGPLGIQIREERAPDGDGDHEADFYVLRKTTAPAVLVEQLFFTNRADALFLMSDAGQEALVETLVSGIAPWLALPAHFPLT